MQANPVIAVVGLGTMGCGISTAALAAGLRVRAIDSTPAQTAISVERLLNRLQSHVEVGLLPASVLPAGDDLVLARDLNEVCETADVVIEAVPEMWDVKRDVLDAVSEATPRIIASNTSSFPIDDLASSVRDARRFLGIHFFNPAEWIPGVELIPGTATDPLTLATTTELLSRLGKQATTVKASPGFIANRVQLALFAECLRCVDEGLATPEDVDRIVRSTFGFRLPVFGPFAIADMAGLDVYGSILGTLSESYGARFEVPDSLRTLLDSGSFGIKTGGGYSQYSTAEVDALLTRRDTAYARLIEATTAQSPTDTVDQAPSEEHTS